MKISQIIPLTEQVLSNLSTQSAARDLIAELHSKYPSDSPEPGSIDIPVYGGLAHVTLTYHTSRTVHIEKIVPQPRESIIVLGALEMLQQAAAQAGVELSASITNTGASLRPTLERGFREAGFKSAEATDYIWRPEAKQTLSESATGVLFHYAPALNAAETLEQGHFQLSNAIGKESEEEYIHTTGELERIKKTVARLLASKISGLTGNAYARMRDNLILGTPEEKREMRYNLRLRGFSDQEIDKITQLLQHKPRSFLPFYLSTTRSRTGGYHKHPTQNAVLFTLDGDYLNRHNYVTKPIDYHGGWWRLNPYERGREAEDRIFSRHSKLPLVPVVKSVDVYLMWDKPDRIQDDENRMRHRSDELRRIINAADDLGIPVYFYRSYLGWIRRSRRDRVDVEEVKKTLLPPPEPSTYESGMYARHISAWLELLKKNASSELSKDADEILYKYILYYHGDPPDIQLRGDLHSAKPGSKEYPLAAELVEYMVKHKIKSTAELSRILKKKWEAIRKREHESQ